MVSGVLPPVSKPVGHCGFSKGSKRADYQTSPKYSCLWFVAAVSAEISAVVFFKALDSLWRQMYGLLKEKKRNEFNAAAYSFFLRLQVWSPGGGYYGLGCPISA
jgi:hypothetical protein